MPWKLFKILMTCLKTILSDLVYKKDNKDDISKNLAHLQTRFLKTYAFHPFFFSLTVKHSKLFPHHCKAGNTI